MHLRFRLECPPSPGVVSPGSKEPMVRGGAEGNLGQAVARPVSRARRDSASGQRAMFFDVVSGAFAPFTRWPSRKRTASQPDEAPPPRQTGGSRGGHHLPRWAAIRSHRERLSLTPASARVDALALFTDNARDRFAFEQGIPACCRGFPGPGAQDRVEVSGNGKVAKVAVMRHGCR